MQIILGRTADILQNLKDQTNLIFGCLQQGFSACNRFEEFGERKDVDEAIAQFSIAINLAPLGSPLLPTLFSCLRLPVIVRLDIFGDGKDIDAAIRQQTGAVNLTPL